MSDPIGSPSVCKCCDACLNFKKKLIESVDQKTVPNILTNLHVSDPNNAKSFIHRRLWEELCKVLVFDTKIQSDLENHSKYATYMKQRVARSFGLPFLWTLRLDAQETCIGQGLAETVNNTKNVNLFLRIKRSNVPKSCLDTTPSAHKTAAMLYTLCPAESPNPDEFTVIPLTKSTLAIPWIKQLSYYKYIVSCIEKIVNLYCVFNKIHNNTLRQICDNGEHTSLEVLKIVYFEFGM